jgi:hypothetical protein
VLVIFSFNFFTMRRCNHLFCFSLVAFLLLKSRAQDAVVATPLIIPEDAAVTPLIIPEAGVATPLIIPDTPLVIPDPADNSGANLAVADLGDPDDYDAPIGNSDSRYFRIQASGEYGYRLDDDDALEITTINGAPTTVQVAVATATAAADGLEIGDIAVYLPAAAALSLRNAVVVGLQGCGVLPAMLKRWGESNLSRRQAGLSECLIQVAQVGAQNPAAFDGIGLANFENLNLPLAQGIIERWERLLQTQIVGAIRAR